LSAGPKAGSLGPYVAYRDAVGGTAPSPAAFGLARMPAEQRQPYPDAGASPLALGSTPQGRMPRGLPCKPELAGTDNLGPPSVFIRWLGVWFRVDAALRQ
jgi:hypothetical protein